MSAAVVGDAFARCARRTPQQVAVISGGQSLTYAQLDTQSNQMAHRLIALGAGQESAIGVCATPSIGLAVALLGVLKAGAAFVPLDPGYPARRLAHLLTDSDCRIVIAEPQCAGRIASTGAQRTILDTGLATIAGQPTTAPTVTTALHGTACVIYTSGSTGAPKGVLITHRGLTNLAAAAAAEFGLGPGDRFLQLASVSFSAVLEEVFPSLLCGATLVLAGYLAALPTVPHFLEVLRRHRITGFEITTAYWHRLVDELVASGARLPASVRFVVMGGDRVSPDRVLAWRRFGIPLIHVYGPTEATATASYFHSARETADPAGLLPIGRPIANTEIRLLGDDLRAVPDGAIGEVFVGGAALARGYHGAPAATAERFVPDPYGAAGQRLYRTGDQARLRPAGTLEFLGRLDHQIKVRGIRIEPGEVEAALASHPRVSQAIVTVHDREDPTDRCLVAYLTPAGARQPGAAELRDHLAAILPRYMIPAVFMTLEAIPLTQHGKVDHAALPEPKFGVSGGCEPPRDSTEAELAEIWAAVLRLDTVGACDDFFALGGNSLQAMLIVARARRRFGVDLVPGDLMRTPTVRAVAGRITRLQAALPATVQTSAEVARWIAKRALIEKSLAARTGKPRTSPVSVTQQGMWVLDRMAGQAPLYNEAWECRLLGELDTAAFEQALRDIICRHETLRTSITLVDGRPTQVVEPPGPLPLRYVDLSELPGPQQLASARARRDTEVQQRIDPSRGQLLRATLYRLAPDDHLLVVTAHHLVFDGLSKEVLVGELAEGYRAHRDRRDAHYPALPMQYGDFAVWQHDHLSGQTLRRLVERWQRRLAGAPQTLDLPTDRPRRAQLDLTGETITVGLPPGLRSSVHTLARDQRVTPFMVLLTAYYVLLHRRSGQHDLCIGTPVAGRTRPGIDGLIGCFINTVVLRAAVRPGSTFQELLDAVRETTTDALEDQELPFDKLVELLRPARPAGRNPLFQALFATEDRAPLPRTAGDLRIDRFDTVPTGVAKFELAVTVIDHGDTYAVSANYRSTLFDAETVRSMLLEYQALLEEFVPDPGRPLAATTRGSDAGAQVSKQLLAMWQAAFANDGITEHDEFFELGGYSLLAVELVAGIQDRFGVQVSLTDFFDAHTVARLSELVVTLGGTEQAAPEPPAAGDAVGKTLSEIIAEVERLSDDEVRAALSAVTAGDDHAHRR